jgi:transposase
VNTLPAATAVDVPSVDARPTAIHRRGAAVADVRASAERLRAAGRDDDAVEFLLAAYGAVFEKNHELALLVAKLRRAGRRSEKIDPGQLTLLFEQLLALQSPVAVVDALEAEVSSEEDAALERELEAADAAQRAKGEPRRRARRDWRTSPAVTHEVHECAVEPEARRCATCGGEQAYIGTDVTHRLELVPAHFVEHEYQLAKYACPTCKNGVTTAPAPPQVLERSAAGTSLLADIVVSKYVDHCPLRRLERIYGRDGVELAASTMSDWVAGVADLFAPLVDRLALRVRAAIVIRTDATGLRVLDPSSPAHIELGTVWCYVGDDRVVLFRYTPTGEGATGPWAFLAGRQGYVQADAASVFDRLYTGQVATAVEVGCWAHARRRLVDLQDTDARVAYPLKLIARLYRIERLADLEDRSADARCALRQERSRGLTEKLRRWLVATLAAEPPSTAFAKAGSYFVNQWAALTRFLEDGRLDLDNNLCEQQLRGIALGRKNFLFAGSHAAAERAATLYSVLRTCAQFDVPPLPYLSDVLPKLASGAYADRLDDLLPDRWQATQPSD